LARDTEYVAEGGSEDDYPSIKNREFAGGKWHAYSPEAFQGAGVFLALEGGAFQAARNMPEALSKSDSGIVFEGN
jgi:hypothetical protein